MESPDLGTLRHRNFMLRKAYEWKRQDENEQVQYQVGYCKTVFDGESHRAVLKLLCEGSPVRSKFRAATEYGKQDERNCP